ncbi:Aste57867_21387 [Aphanomyces stellatus]|uniref:Aste57867_21387 protein n=1 Tax=Aphanomyces stellatus TaxID=120398 RepID=A0A485LI26_9STRA|nr:hypothetical protein As57867_021318 [Aphanomyces stellatus]VFT98058.1 Aste57867_21387 [Aphanomyces stellatus]
MTKVEPDPPTGSETSPTVHAVDDARRLVPHNTTGPTALELPVGGATSLPLVSQVSGPTLLHTMERLHDHDDVIPYNQSPAPRFRSFAPQVSDLGTKPIKVHRGSLPAMIAPTTRAPPIGETADDTEAVKGGEPPPSLSDAPPVLLKQTSSRRRVLDSISHALHHLLPSENVRRQSIEVAAAIARRASLMSRRFSTAGLIDAGQLEAELNNMAASHTSMRALQQRAAFYIPLHSRPKVVWDTLVALSTLYAIIVVPADVAFDLYPTAPALVTLQTLIDATFLVDIAVVFRTSYLVRATREEVTDVHRIWRHYLGRAFWIDATSSLPTSMFGDAFRQSRWAYLRLLVLCRVFRLSTSPTVPAFMAWASRTFTSYAVRLVVLVSLYLLLHHYIACSFYALICYEGDAANNPTTLWDIPFAPDDPLVVKYVSAYYRSLDVTSGNDLGPQTAPERIFGSVMLAVGVIANAWCVTVTVVFVVVCVVTRDMNRVDDERVLQQERIEKCLRSCHAGGELQTRVMEFYGSAHSHETAHHADELLVGLPEKLHIQLAAALNHVFLNKVPLFHSLEADGVLALLECVEETVAMNGDIVIHAGEEGRAFYMIKMGTVEVFDDRGNTRVSLKHLAVGDYFGEMSLLQGGRASASIVATSFCLLLVLYKDIFHWIMRENEHVKAHLHQTHDRRKSETIEAKRRSLASATNRTNAATAAAATLGRRNTAVGRLRALLARMRMRRAARRLVLVQRIRNQSHNSSSGMSVARKGPMEVSHPNSLAGLKGALTTRMRLLMSMQRTRTPAARALRAVGEMSQITAKELVDARSITPRLLAPELYKHN